MKAEYCIHPCSELRSLQKIILMIYAFVLPVFSQSFQISIHPSEIFSVDKFAREVYYLHFITRAVYVANLDSGTVHLSQFQTIPVFANNSRKCAFKYYDSVYIYDFESGSKIKIAIDSNFTYSPNYIFSPDDRFLLYPMHYYSFQDDSTYDIQFDDFLLFEDWMNDSTALLFGGNIIRSFNFITNIWDTVLTSSAEDISAFAHNKNEGLLYYSPFIEWGTPKILAFNPTTNQDSLIFDPLINDPNNNCWNNVLDITDMEWSEDDRSLAFFSPMRFETTAPIYIYNSDIDTIYKYTDCYFEGYRKGLRWFGLDTLIYSKVTANTLYIEGFALDHPVSVDEEPINELSENFSIGAYPNPFNGAITINLLGKFEEPELCIYNINGERIKTFELKGTSKFEQVWDGTTDSGGIVSSGVYLLTARDKKNPSAKRISAKITYLK